MVSPSRPRTSSIPPGVTRNTFAVPIRGPRCMETYANSSIARRRALAHLLIRTRQPARRLHQNVVVAAQVKNVFNHLHELSRGVLVFQGTEERPRLSHELGRFGVSREMRFGVDMNKPR